MDGRLDEAKRVVADRVSRVVGLTRNWDTQDIVGVESDRDMPADRAIYTRLELAVKELDKDGIIALFEALPEFSGDDFIWPVIAVLHLHVRLLRYSV